MKASYVTQTSPPYSFSNANRRGKPFIVSSSSRTPHRVWSILQAASPNFNLSGFSTNSRAAFRVKWVTVWFSKGQAEGAQRGAALPAAPVPSGGRKRARRTQGKGCGQLSTRWAPLGLLRRLPPFPRAAEFGSDVRLIVFPSVHSVTWLWKGNGRDSSYIGRYRKARQLSGPHMRYQTNKDRCRPCFWFPSVMPARVDLWPFLTLEITGNKNYVSSTLCRRDPGYKGALVCPPISA